MCTGNGGGQRDGMCRGGARCRDETVRTSSGWQNVKSVAVGGTPPKWPPRSAGDTICGNLEPAGSLRWCDGREDPGGAGERFGERPAEVRPGEERAEAAEAAEAAEVEAAAEMEAAAGVWVAAAAEEGAGERREGRGERDAGLSVAVGWRVVELGRGEAEEARGEAEAREPDDGNQLGDVRPASDASGGAGDAAADDGTPPASPLPLG